MSKWSDREAILLASIIKNEKVPWLKCSECGKHQIWSIYKTIDKLVFWVFNFDEGKYERICDVEYRNPKLPLENKYYCYECNKWIKNINHYFGGSKLTDPVSLRLDTRESVVQPKLR